LIRLAIRAILRRPMPRLAATLPLVAAALLACGTPCGDLADHICLCQPAGSLRDACRRTVSDQIGKGNPKPGQTQEAFCEDRLPHCKKPSEDPGMCERLLTDAGRVDCGLAFPPAQ
jgi:hypothetical protein